MKRLFILDATLRDAGKFAGAAVLSLEDKLSISRQLEKLGVDIIETGYPASSKEEFETSLAVSSQAVKSAVSVMARPVKEDILRAWEAVKQSSHPVLHITTSIHSRIIETSVQAIRWAASTGADVEIGVEDAAKAKKDFLLEFYRAAIDAGAVILHVPDACGIMTPEEYGELIVFLIKNLPEAREGRVRLSASCRNDLGLAAANTLSAIKSGAAQFEASVLGIGERAGNAPLEEVIAALYQRPEKFAENSRRINPEEVIRTCQAVSARTGILISPGKAVAGTNALEHKGWMEPGTFGRIGGGILADVNSGPGGLKYRIKKAFANMHGRLRTLSDDELVRFSGKRHKPGLPLIELKKMEIEQDDLNSFSVTLSLAERGVDLFPRYTGKTPLEALIGVLTLVLPAGLTLNHYSCGCAGCGGTGSFQAEVSLNARGMILTGSAGGQAGGDYLQSIAAAFIEALNRFKVL